MANEHFLSNAFHFHSPKAIAVVFPQNIGCFYLMSIFLKSVKSQWSPFSTEEKEKRMRF